MKNGEEEIFDIFGVELNIDDRQNKTIDDLNLVTNLVRFHFINAPVPGAAELCRMRVWT